MVKGGSWLVLKLRMRLKLKTVLVVDDNSAQSDVRRAFDYQ